MIYTVTLNPSLDYMVDVEKLRMGKTNRTTKEEITVGGKGINVSIVLRNLGFESIALGFYAGFTGQEIRKKLQQLDVKEKFIEVKSGVSRINIKLRAKEETEINGMGPEIGRQEMECLYGRCATLKSGDVLVLAGSIPSSMPSSTYCDIMKVLEGKQIRTIVDATGELLLQVLPYHPFLIKPNKQELGEIFQTEIHDNAQVIDCAKQLQEKGARNVIVSMAGEGAVFIGENGSVYESKAPSGTVVNSVGAGDSMVAGFLAGFLDGGDVRKAFQMGVCTGSASAFSEHLATKKDVEAVQNSHCFDFLAQ